MNAYEISMSGLNVEWRRLEVIAQNLANMNTTRMPDGLAFQPLRLISGPGQNFAAHLGNADASNAPAGVQVLEVETIPNGLRTAFEPHHPHADADGFVYYPNVDHASEMTLMVRTSRAYEANLAVVSIAQQMYSRALEMGRGA